MELRRLVPHLLMLLCLAACGEAATGGTGASGGEANRGAEEAGRQGDPADWCTGHGVPESQCTLCNPALINQYRASGDWCPEHGFPESVCPQCNPMRPPGGGAAPAPSDWCAGHGLPESMCTLCNPALINQYRASGDWCPEHGFPESVCPQCNPQTPPAGVAPPAAPVDWCTGHGLPESKCTLCNPELIGRFQAAGDWCQEHGFPESACPQCNPQTPPSNAPADWCGEHGLPESMCTRCNASLVTGFRASGDWCAEHGFPESACPQCNPQPPPAGAGAPGEVTLSAEALEEIELEVGAVRAGRIAVSLEVPAEVQLNPDRVAHVSSLVPGQLTQVQVAIGDTVSAGQALASLRSVELGQARADLRRTSALHRVAQQNRDRQTRLREEGIASERSLLEAQLALDEARAERDAARSRLRVFGIRGGAGAELVLRSPIDGVIVQRHATRGENVGAENTLFVVADLSRVWVMGRVYEQQLAQVSPGMSASLRLNAYPERSWTGSVDFVGALIDESTRTLPVRVSLDNPDGLLRPGLFGSLTLSFGARAAPVAIVPRSAVQDMNNQTIVFAPGQGDGHFIARTVTLGRSNTRDVEILEGVRQGERVVVQGAFTLKSEMLRGLLGQGCAH